LFLGQGSIDSGKKVANEAIMLGEKKVAAWRKRWQTKEERAKPFVF